MKLLILVGGLLILAGCTTWQGGGIFTSPTPTTASDLLSTFRVTGNARDVSITYRYNGGSEEFDDVRLPWERSLLLDVGDSVSVFAFAFDGGLLECEWTVERAAGASDEARADGDSSTSVSCGGTWIGFTYD